MGKEVQRVGGQVAPKGIKDYDTLYPDTLDNSLGFQWFRGKNKIGFHGNLRYFEIISSLAIC